MAPLQNLKKAVLLPAPQSVHSVRKLEDIPKFLPTIISRNIIHDHMPLRIMYTQITASCVGIAIICLIINLKTCLFVFVDTFIGG